jgi:hypothetical protein
VEIQEFDLLLLLTTDHDEGDMRHEIPISITGLGIIFYSPFAVAGIGEGEDYCGAGNELSPLPPSILCSSRRLYRGLRGSLAHIGPLGKIPEIFFTPAVLK